MSGFEGNRRAQGYDIRSSKQTKDHQASAEDSQFRETRMTVVELGSHRQAGRREGGREGGQQVVGLGNRQGYKAEH